MLGTEQPARWEWRKWTFRARLFLSLLFIPPLSFLPLTASLQGGDWLGLTVLYGIFGSAAMLALGVPLLLVFTRFRITGFLPFACAGTVSAVVTILIMNGRRDPGMLPIFAVIGTIAGYLFRLALFGFKRS